MEKGNENDGVFTSKKTFARGTGKSASSLGVRLGVRDPDGLIGGGQRGSGLRWFFAGVGLGLG